MKAGDRPLNIGITCYPTIGGSGILASSLGEALARRGHGVHFISYERPVRMPANRPEVSFHPVVINDYELFKYPDYTLPLSVKMAEVAREHRLDVLHVHYAVPHATAAILARAMLAPGERPRIVTTLHGTDTTLLARDPGYAPAIEHALTSSDAVTTVSHFLAAETQKVLSLPREIEVIHNFFAPRAPGRPPESVRQELGLRDEALIVHLSNLRPVKRIDLLLQAVARIQNSPPFKLLVLAGGDFARWRPEVRRLGLQDRIVVREQVVEVEDYLQIADLALFASEMESFCLSILEAMFFGCPSVATRVGGIPEVVRDGETGILVAPGDVTALAEETGRLLRDVERRRRLGRAARARADGRFSAEAIVPQYEALYRRVCG